MPIRFGSGKRDHKDATDIGTPVEQIEHMMKLVDEAGLSCDSSENLQSWCDDAATVLRAYADTLEKFEPYARREIEKVRDVASTLEYYVEG